MVEFPSSLVETWLWCYINRMACSLHEQAHFACKIFAQCNLTPQREVAKRSEAGYRLGCTEKRKFFANSQKGLNSLTFKSFNCWKLRQKKHSTACFFSPTPHQMSNANTREQPFLRKANEICTFTITSYT